MLLIFFEGSPYFFTLSLQNTEMLIPKSKREQNLRTPGTYINNYWIFVKSIEMTSNSRHKTDRKQRKHKKKPKNIFPKK